MGVVEKCLYSIAADVIASELDELATGLSRLDTSIAKAGVRLLGINEPRVQSLV